PAQQTGASAQQTDASAQQTDASAQQTDASTQRAGVSSRPAPPGAEDGPAHRVAARADVMRDVAYRVVADHIRCLVFAIADGAVPANEGRGYVLRRILRRAVRYGRQYLRLHARSCNEDEPRASARADNQTPSRPRTASGHTSAAEPFLHKLVPIVVDTMAGAFPELKREAERVAEIIRDEEASFGKTLDRGIKLFEEAAQFAINYHHGRISGEDAFKLHDTYGFPIDLTELMAEERNLTVDIGEYERLMEAARERARQGTSTEAVSKLLSIPQRYLTEETRDDYKYTQLSTQSRFLFATGSSPDTGTPPISSIGQMGWVFDTTCFYAEQGGQIGDTGLVKLASGESAKVLTTKKSGNLVIHIVAWSKVDRGPKPDEEVTLCVDAVSRLKTTQNHTATHILNWALREVLGDHVQQKGSLVDPEKTRFDLSHPSQITDEELARIESLVNEKIAADLPVYAKEVPQADALKINGLRAVFGEKYPDRVRVVSIGAQIGEPGVADPNTLLGDPDNPKWRQYSVEFCGGTHLGRTGEAGRFRLIEESAVAKGVRRVVGVTGERAEQAEAAATALARQLKEAAAADDAALPRRIAEITALMSRAELPVVEKLRLRTDLDHLQAKARRIQKQADKQGAADVLARTATLLEDAEQINGCAVISAALGRVTVDQLRAASDSLRQRAGSAAVFLAGESAGKVVLLAAMTPDVVKRGIKAGDLIKAVAPMVGGKGGGRPDMAQGGGTDISKMDEAAHTAGRWLREKLAAS
ncbi:MAG: alanine--tRNA ligase-related protein, partial [Phycisphaerae bacterium]